MHGARDAAIDAQDLRGQRGDAAMRAVVAEQVAHILGRIR